ncbi:hypothetical protein UFOVP221_3 [uncultured Caudovirales phage]|uniref:Uncharacterized protein n=1 Tax=uncultured Caudovirales phage TaxID=2100421 RepID=A0A6J7WS32_9CAUD|nr:hypothetical protein UFOVP221_3 [uncultured Caudovirales phage]
MARPHMEAAIRRGLEKAQSEATAKAHPVLSAMSFAHLTNDPSIAGASLDVNTNHVAQGGEDKVFVGGEPDSSGVRIPTEYTEVGISPAQVLEQQKRVRSQTSQADVHVGSWIDPDVERGKQKVEWDASRAYPSIPEALAVAADRNEKEVFDMKTLENIPNPKYDPKKKQS